MSVVTERTMSQQILILLILCGTFFHISVICMYNNRLNAEEQIQMVTALVLELIQCVVKLPSVQEEQPHRPGSPTSEEEEKRRKEAEKADQVRNYK